MSQVVWDPEQPERAAHSTEPQIGAPSSGVDSVQAADAAPTSRRAARELRQRQEAEAAAASQLPVAAEAAAAGPLRPRKTTARKQRSRQAASRRRVATAPSSRPAVLPKLSRPSFPARAMLTKLMSFSAMVGVAGMLVATSIPANAFFPSAPEETLQAEQETLAASANIGVQSLDVKDATAAAKTQERDSYTVLSLTEQLRGKYDTAAFRFTNNPNGTIQWPFATGVPISSGFGDRYACSYCSTNHLGVDFVPGAGSPVQAIADGVVREVNPGGSAYGVNIIIDHEINGVKVTSLYAHLQWGSPSVAAGQAVTVGQYIGDVGSTGASTGPHLHLEIHVDETPVDPFVWLKANAN